MMLKFKMCSPFGCGILAFIGLLSVGTQCHAQFGFCYVKNADMTCQELIGVDWGIVDICESPCSRAGDPCTPNDVYREINPLINKAVYEKNRATGIMLTVEPNGYRSFAENSVICGFTGTCGPTCTLIQIEGSWIFACVPVKLDQTILFFDFADPCNQ